MKTLARLRLALHIRRTESLIRLTHEDAQRCPERAAHYLGELLPALSLEFANLRQQQRHISHPPSMPVLGQIHAIQPTTRRTVGDYFMRCVLSLGLVFMGGQLVADINTAYAEILTTAWADTHTTGAQP